MRQLNRNISPATFWLTVGSVLAVLLAITGNILYPEKDFIGLLGILPFVVLSILTAHKMGVFKKFNLSKVNPKILAIVLFSLLIVDLIIGIIFIPKMANHDRWILGIPLAIVVVCLISGLQSFRASKCGKILRRVALILVPLLVIVISVLFVNTSVRADSVDLYWYPVGGTGTGNWNGDGHWATDSGGGGLGHANPLATNTVYFTATSFTGAGQIVTVNSTASCLSMNWTGATQTPTLACGTNALNYYGNCTFISAMAVTGTTGYPSYKGTGTCAFTSNGLSLACQFGISLGGTGTLTLQDNLTATSLVQSDGVLITAGKTITVGPVTIRLSGAKTLTPGASIINCSAWDASGATALTITANTSTINVSGTGAFAGGTPTGSYYNVNLNGTAHTVSGTFSYNILTRNGTATNANSITFTSGTTITGVTTALIGNSRANQLLAQSSTLGTAATITTTNWTGTTNVDLMDITATNAVDFSAAGLNILTIGNCGGNTGITFPASVTHISAQAGNWSHTAEWDVATIPLPQDDVTCSHNMTVDMPRIGKSITFTGTPTVSLSNDVSNYGSFTLVSGMTWSPGTKDHQVRGRGIYTFTTDGKTVAAVKLYAPTGTLTLQDAFTGNSILQCNAGTLTTNDVAIVASVFYLGDSAAITRTINLGSSTITLNSIAAGSSKIFALATGSLTFNAEASTIILTNSTTNAQTFAGGSLTYNNVTVQGAGAYALTITGSNIFNTFTVDRSVAAKTITFTDTTVQTVANFVCATSGATVVTLQGTGVAGWGITKTGGSYVNVDYMSISRSTGLPTGTWYASTHSTNGGNNVNWYFINPTLTTTYGEMNSFGESYTLKGVNINSPKIAGATGISNVTYGTVAPTSTPLRVGDIYVDTTAHKVYLSDGTISSGNWLPLN